MRGSIMNVKKLCDALWVSLNSSWCLDPLQIAKGSDCLPFCFAIDFLSFFFYYLLIKFISMDYKIRHIVWLV